MFLKRYKECNERNVDVFVDGFSFLCIRLSRMIICDIIYKWNEKEIYFF